MSNIHFIFLGCILLINCLKEKNRDVTITLRYIHDEYIGKKGTIAIESASDISDFDYIDTSKTILFQSYLVNGINKYKIDCGFFKEEGGKLYTFCNFDEKIPAGNYSLDISEVTKITYKDYNIALKQDGTLEFKKYDSDIIDLYSDKQTITVEEGKDTYDLRFKISTYTKMPILLNLQIAIDCSQEKDELVCQITRNQLESILAKEEDQLFMGYINYNYRAKKFPLISKIVVKYNLQKKDIFVGITKLIENVAEDDTLIAYETNITDISNVFTSIGVFDLEFSNSNTGTKSCSCSFRKYDENPLLIVCFINNEGTNWLKEITQEKIFDNLNIKYKFRIQTVNNEEKINCKTRTGMGTFIFYNYPYILDFTKSDSFTVEYGMENPKSLVGLTFNENSKDLSCNTIGREIKRCTVTKSPFDGKKNGYYFIKHSNHLDGKSTSYEGFPVKVILDGSGNGSKYNKVSITMVYSLLLVLIMF